MSEEDFTRLVEKHLFVLEGDTLDQEGNKKLQICGVDALFEQLALTYFSQQSELLISELTKAKALTEHLTAEERNEYFDLAINNLVFNAGEKDEHITTLELNKSVTSKISEWKENITTEEVYYHGSPNYFSVKDIKPNNKGLIFFTKDKNIAVRYATNDFSGNKIGDEYNIIKVHLDVKKTFNPEEHDNNPEIIELLSNTGNFENVGRLPDYDTLASEALYAGEWSVLETKEFIDGLKKMGYDSILIDNRPHYAPNYKGEQTFNKDIAVFYTNAINPI